MPADRDEFTKGFLAGMERAARACERRAALFRRVADGIDAGEDMSPGFQDFAGPNCILSPKDAKCATDQSRALAQMSEDDAGLIRWEAERVERGGPLEG